MATHHNVLDEDKVTKLLGLRWQPEMDIMTFAERPIDTNPITTKRYILQSTSRIYDPLGILSPVTVRAKLLLQDIWKEHFTWDTPLPITYQRRWLNIAADLNTSVKTQFYRHYFTDVDDKSVPCLHVFVDASTQSYGATVYISKGVISTLVMAKNRVAPVKTLTLPKLELMAAVIEARLSQHLQSALGIQEICYWTDSQIVLHWQINTENNNRFVRTRVSEITALTGNQNWRYCPTQENPADLLTRGISAKQYQESNLWFNGPSWITQKSQWPTWNIRVSTVLSTSADDKTGSRTNEESPTHMTRKNSFAIQDVIECQQNFYSKEISNLQSGKSRLAVVRQLRLYLDSDGYIRCGGRIHNAPLDENTRFPILLPAKHHLTKLIIFDAHEKQLHSGTSATICHLQQKYWIPIIRQCVKSLLRKCTICRKINSKPYLAPDPPPLPTYRVKNSSPFAVTGIDFSGALYVRGESGRESKTYQSLKYDAQLAKRIYSNKMGKDGRPGIDTSKWLVNLSDKKLEAEEHFVLQNGMNLASPNPLFR
ncbi:uncharacterized protein LOC128553495 [Mercenaria mercenaria]|uniref:uncharacterized protein LOC128553495 n=1 Tax=Mercenaria mercenaria TaxID=6596 RepID=UPI00234E6B1E|nr:uncharacterized protein LOC128553495 [Mercenaria mercenaria]